MIGNENGLGALLRKNYAPYLKLNGCLAHLLNLVNKHSFDQYNTLKGFNELITKVYKSFMNAPKRLLDLERWYLLKNERFHRLLTIYDISWLRFNSVNNYRKNFVAVLDCLLKLNQIFLKTKKIRDKAAKLYN